MKRGFTLIELAIVLIIIGLLIGGVLSGRELITHAKLNSQLRQFKEFELASSTFYSKYGQLPGDFSRAHAFWDQTNNGDNDGMIDPREYLMYWHQLNLAELLQTIAAADTTEEDADYDCNINLPKGRDGQSCVGILLKGLYDHTTKQITSFSYSAYVWGAPLNDPAYSVTGPVVNAAGGYSMDVKVDDGKPRTGRVIGWNATDEINDDEFPCELFVGTDINDPNDYEYNTSNEDLTCAMGYKIKSK